MLLNDKKQSCKVFIVWESGYFMLHAVIDTIVNTSTTASSIAATASVSGVSATGVAVMYTITCVRKAHI